MRRQEALPHQALGKPHLRDQHPNTQFPNECSSASFPATCLTGRCFWFPGGSLASRKGLWMPTDASGIHIHLPQAAASLPARVLIVPTSLLPGRLSDSVFSSIRPPCHHFLRGWLRAGFWGFGGIWVCCFVPGRGSAWLAA